MPQTYHVVPLELHNALVQAAFEKRGYLPDEAADATRFCENAARHGIRTHNAIKALHLDELFGSHTGGWVPGAQIEEKPTRFKAAKVWDAHHKLGQAVAYRAIEECIRLADEFGTGTVSVDNATHYLWGGGYVMEAARRGYIAYTNCTSAIAEVVPFGGKHPTLGTNPHSWGFPTTEAVGFPIVIDWATSTVAMGRVQQFQREGKQLPPGSAVDAAGKETTDPNAAVALLPFGAHKGYGLGLIDELYAAFIGGSLPTIRGHAKNDGDKHASTFFFQITHPDALSSGSFASGRSQAQNIKAVLGDVLGHGNERCLLPGQLEAEAGKLSEVHGGLLFTAAELEAFAEIAAGCGAARWDAATLKTVDI